MFKAQAYVSLRVHDAKSTTTLCYFSPTLCFFWKIIFTKFELKSELYSRSKLMLSSQIRSDILMNLKKDQAQVHCDI